MIAHSEPSPLARRRGTARLLVASLASVLLAACSGDGGGGNGPAPSCASGASEACACAGGYGIRSCTAGAWDACDCSAVSVCPGGLSVTGVLQTSVADVTLTGLGVAVDATFKQDVDPADSGCVGHTVVAIGGERGCRLQLDFGPVVGAMGGLRKVTFVADSLCPGFLDASEGTYESGPGYGAWWSGPMLVQAPAGADAVCRQGSEFTFPDRTVQLARASGGGLTVNMKDVRVSGDLALKGDPSAGFLCASSGCAGDYRDGGGGWCVAGGACAPGYHDGGGGACVLAGTCSPGFHDDGAGACVPLGTCAEGWHDGGDGSCVPVGSCAPTYHDGGFGACAGGTSCEPGFRWDGGLSICTVWSAAGYPVRSRNWSSFATPLKGGGVLYGGGFEGSGCLSDVEVWDPATSTWTLTGAMASPRCGAEAVTLADGRVLVAGGSNGFGYVRDAEIWSPATGVFAPAGTMSQDRSSFTLTRLAGGKVVAVGGDAAPGTAEVWDPVTGQWTAAASPRVGRMYHSATALVDGRLLVVGGYLSSPVTEVELYDPDTNLWSYTGGLSAGRWYHASARLQDGSVVVFGGTAGAEPSVERWSPELGTWLPVGSVRGYPDSDTAALLPSGKVLVLENAGRANELFDPATNTLAPAGSLMSPVSWAKVVRLESGYLMALGEGAFAQIYDGPQ